ncbi:MAG: tRNA (adenosine(37)-N6)-threonylcarbamoyltransferase complex transferase subunit TsaD [Alphaproteobacteria bacterium]
MILLGIETSCDETAAAIVSEHGIQSNLVHSQLEEHRPFGGVVPEIAARSHIEYLDSLIKRALNEAELNFSNLDGIAATAGPGLIGGLIVGLTMAKSIALVHDLPLIAVNHLEAHALTPRITAQIDFPYLLLLISGGHCQFLIVDGVGHYRRLGTTIDDAPGEAFDKVARMVGLDYPGGPAIERAASQGRANRYALPRPLQGRAGCDFSFSGLKTAVSRIIAKGKVLEKDVPDLCASFQEAVADILTDRLRHAAQAFVEAYGKGVLVVAGGVAANGILRERLKATANEIGFSFAAPPLSLCTDNAAMVAWAGIERLRLNMVDDLTAAPRARWPLDPNAAPAIGAGVKA